jgi:signal transduction histidine kinase
MLGFTVVFSLWAGSIYYLTLRLAAIEASSAAVHAHHIRGQELLLTVRAHVLLASLHVRDALDERDPQNILPYSQELHRLRQHVEQALERYLPDVDLPTEREHWSRLEAELREYWETMLPLLTWDPTLSTTGPNLVLQTQVVPKREVVIRISERILALEDEAFQQERHRFGVMYGRVRQQIWAVNGIAVLLGLAIASLAARYAGRLESRIRHQHAEVLDNRRELQELSAQLVRAQENERRTIARELHDEIGQALTAIDVQMAIAERQIGSSGTRAPALTEARALTERAIASVRDLSELLHPATLDDFGLPATLDWYLQAFSERTGVRTQLIQADVAERLPADVDLCAYRIVQEALTNVVRHAQASSCRVFLQRLPHSLLVTIEDDGRGFDPGLVSASRARRGFGLVGIRERVTALQGTHRLESGPGKGTRLTVELPVHSVSAAVDRTPFSPAAIPVAEEH